MSSLRWSAAIPALIALACTAACGASSDNSENPIVDASTADAPKSTTEGGPADAPTDSSSQHDATSQSDSAHNDVLIAPQDGAQPDSTLPDSGQLDSDSGTPPADAATENISVVDSGPKVVGSFRAMTYNIERCGSLGLKLDEVAGVIVAQKVDAVGLQEVDHQNPGSGFKKEAEELATKTGLTEQYFGCAVGCGSTLPGRYGIAILSRHTLTDRVKTFLPNQLDGTVNENDEIEPRVLLCGTVRPASVPAVRFCVTHLTNGATDESIKIRKLQTKAIVDLLTPELSAYQGRVVLVGDFNETPSGATYPTLTGLLKDSWAEAGSGSGFTIPSDAPTVRFDYILHGSGLGAATAAFVPDTTASDHRPVVADLPILAGN